MKVYNYNILPISNPNIPIQIINSGSSGNAIIIKPIQCLIELGLPFYKIEPYLNQIQTICLTHQHGDHLNESTLLQIIDLHPRIKIVIPRHLFNHIKNQTLKLKLSKTAIIISNGEAIIINDQFKLTGYETPHGDITNMAYTFYIPNIKTHLLYATDLENTNTLPDASFNVILLEANYQEERLENQLKLATHQFDKQWIAKINGNKRHLSEEKAISYVKKHLTQNGWFIPLHLSKTLGSFYDTYE